MKQIKNVPMTFYEFVPEHLELLKDGKQIFAKMKNGDWDLIYYCETDPYGMGGGAVFQSIDLETCWPADEIEYWSFLPNLEN